MQTTTLSFTNLHQYGELFANFFRARRQSFIIQRNWDLPQVDGMEFDQYDTPQSRWVAVHDGGTVLAGMRLTPTTARCGIYSYMIRDAQRGVLGGSIPQDLLWAEAPVDDQAWEATRLFVAHDTPQAIRRKVHARLVETMTSCARDVGAARLLSLNGEAWPRLFSRCGIEAEAIGRMCWIDDGYYQCTSINLTGKMH